MKINSNKSIKDKSKELNKLNYNKIILMNNKKLLTWKSSQCIYVFMPVVFFVLMFVAIKGKKKETRNSIRPRWFIHEGWILPLVSGGGRLQLHINPKKKIQNMINQTDYSDKILYLHLSGKI